MKRNGAAAEGKLSSEVPVIDGRDAHVLPEGSKTASAMQTSYQTLTDVIRAGILVMRKLNGRTNCPPGPDKCMFEHHTWTLY